MSTDAHSPTSTLPPLPPSPSVLHHKHKSTDQPRLVLDIKLIETTIPASPSPTSPVPAPVVSSFHSNNNNNQEPVHLDTTDNAAILVPALRVNVTPSTPTSGPASTPALDAATEVQLTSESSSCTSANSETNTAADTLIASSDLAVVASDGAPAANTIESSQDEASLGTAAADGTPAPTSPSRQEANETWPETPRQFLERVKETVSKAELGNLLSKGSDPFHQAVLRIHMESFDFRRDPIDLALRKFLLDFHFPKEAQQIDRVLEAFASRYHACNPHLFRSSDVVYTIAFSLMLLHTDAHNKNVRYKMTKDQYVRQAKTIDGVNTIPADILEVLYDNITFLKFVYAEDDMDVDGQRIAEVQPTSTGSWFPRRRTASTQRTDSYSMIRHGSIAHLAPDLSDLIPFRWPYYWKGTIEMVDNVQINNQFTRAPLVSVPGLRLRLHGHQHSQQQQQPQQPFQQQSINSGFGGTYPPVSARSGTRPDIAGHDDDGDSKAEEQSMPHSSPANWSGTTSTNWTGNSDEEADGCAQLRIVKSGILSRKIDIEQGKKSPVRGWRDLGVILSGSQLLFFTDTAWFQQQRAAQVGFNPQEPPEEDGYFATDIHAGGLPPMPQALISTLESIAVVDSSYQKYPHVFRMVCPNGKQYLFRADSEHEMNDWMAKINYASAFKTAGVRLRNYRVAWANDVYWVKDEQGRHQLRRRRPDPASQPQSPVNMELLDGRAQLIHAKIKDIDRQINTCSASLAAELRLARGLEVMIPLQNSTRQKIVQSATVVGRRLRHLMLERTKLDCFRTILERDLAVVPTEERGERVDADGSLQQQQQPHEGVFEKVHSRRASTVDRALGAHSSASQTQESSESDRPMSFTQQQQEVNWSRSLPGLGDNMDHMKEDEYVLDSNRTSQSSNRPGRPRLNVSEFQRSASDNTLDEHQRTSTTKGADIPMGAAAIQAAIIDSARGHHHLHLNNSTLSSPNLNQYREASAACSSSHLSMNDSTHPCGSSHYAGHPPLSPSSNMSGSGSRSGSGGPSWMLSPESPATQAASRSRALSMPGQRPNMLPRTVSIYSSSSQTASRLRRIFEQGLVHFKINGSSRSSSAASATSSSVTGGSSLKTSTLYTAEMDDEHGVETSAEIKS
ncbi:hypothetical protein EDD11_009213 [Mortierella claussenii]|nr:hypothetical protein EDD11_009213 [Mortierella claussenii]